MQPCPPSQPHPTCPNEAGRENPRRHGSPHIPPCRGKHSDAAHRRESPPRKSARGERSVAAHRREAGGKSRGETPDFKSFHAALTARPPAPAGRRSKQHPRSPARKGGQKTFTGKQRSHRYKAAGTAPGFHKARAPSQTASPIPPSPAHKNRPAQPTAKGCAGRRVSVFGFQRLRE